MRTGGGRPGGAGGISRPFLGLAEIPQIDPSTHKDHLFKICECDMSLQTVESDGSRRKKEKEDRDDLRSENCSIDMIRVEEDQLVLLELGP